MVDLLGLSDAAVGETATKLEGLPEDEKTDGINEMIAALRDATAPKPPTPPA